MLKCQSQTSCMKLARNSHETLHNKGARPRTTPFTKVPETATLFDQKSEQYGTFYLESAFLFGYIYPMDRDNIKKDSDLLESVLDADQRSTNDFKRKIICKDGFGYINKKDGVVDFIDIERPDEVDRRREKLGMESFEEYRKMIAKNSYK